jgi:hypothetical protein
MYICHFTENKRINKIMCRIANPYFYTGFVFDFSLVWFPVFLKNHARPVNVNKFSVAFDKSKEQGNFSESLNCLAPGGTGVVCCPFGLFYGKTCC